MFLSQALVAGKDIEWIALWLPQKCNAVSIAWPDHPQYVLGIAAIRLLFSSYTHRHSQCSRHTLNGDGGGLVRLVGWCGAESGNSWSGRKKDLWERFRTRTGNCCLAAFIFPSPSYFCPGSLSIEPLLHRISTLQAKEPNTSRVRTLLKSIPGINRKSF